MGQYFVYYLRRGHHAEGIHDAVGVLLPDLADEQRAHAGASAPPQGVCELETLQALAALSLFPHHVQDWVDQLCPLCVVTFGPVVSCSTLTWENINIQCNLEKWASNILIHTAEWSDALNHQCMNNMWHRFF